MKTNWQWLGAALLIALLCFAVIVLSFVLEACGPQRYRLREKLGTNTVGSAKRYT